MSSGAPSPAASAGGGFGSPPPVATSSPPVSSSSNNGSTPGASSAPPVSQPSASPPPAAAIPPVSPPPAASSPPPTSSPPPASSPPPTSAPPPSSSNSTQTPRVSPAPVSSPPPAQSPPPPPVITSPPPPPPVKSSPPPSAPVNPSPPPAVTPPGSSTSSPPPVASPPPASSIIPPTPPTKPSTKGSPPSPEAPAPTAIVRSPPPPGKLTPGSPSSTPPTQTSTGNTSNVTPPLKSPPPASSSTPLGGSGSPSSASDGSGGSGGLSGVAIGGIAVGGLIILALIGLLIWCTKKRRRRDGYSGDHFGQPPAGGFPAKSERVYASNSPGSDQYLRKTSSPSTQGYGYENSHRGRHGSSGEVASGVPEHPTPNPGLGNSKSWFTYEELGVATDGFSAQNLIGEGGFGCVYKGYLPDGQVVAVKQLKVGSGQGEREFQAEVEIISRVHHRHLVSLVGYCIAESQRLLVYDYVPNGNLEQHLHGRGRPVMNWVTRQKIAVGAARGLAYLHEDCHPRIIHRDIKSSNILLDDKFEAQVSDFGLAKLASDTSTHVTTRVMGTFGYMAPEYASSGKLTERSDVFSFGVVLLELVTGRKPVDTSQPLGDESLVEWARPLLTCALEEGNFEGLVDPKLENNFDGSEMLRMVEAAAACVRHSAHRRPRMGQVVRVLEHGSAISDLNNGVKPGQSTLYNSAQYSADIRRFRRMAFGSQEDGSDYSGFTSEYEFNPSASSNEFHNSKERKVEPMKYGKNELERQSASGSEYPSSGESETRAINGSYLHRDETSDKSSGEVPSTFRDESLTGR